MPQALHSARWIIYDSAIWTQTSKWVNPLNASTPRNRRSSRLEYRSTHTNLWTGFQIQRVYNEIPVVQLTAPFRNQTQNAFDIEPLMPRAVALQIGSRQLQ